MVHTRYSNPIKQNSEHIFQRLYVYVSCFVTFVFVFVLCHISTFSFLFCFGGTAVAVCLSASYLSIAAVQLDLILCFSFIFYEKAWNHLAHSIYCRLLDSFLILCFRSYLMICNAFCTTDHLALVQYTHIWCAGLSELISQFGRWTTQTAITKQKKETEILTNFQPKSLTVCCLYDSYINYSGINANANTINAHTKCAQI